MLSVPLREISGIHFFRSRIRLILLRCPVFLSPDDLVVLTGYRQKSKQINFLTRLGVPFTLNRWGRPVVLKSALDSLSVDRSKFVRSFGPNWGAVVNGSSS